eukprot:RCo051107
MAGRNCCCCGLSGQPLWMALRGSRFLCGLARSGAARIIFRPFASKPPPYEPPYAGMKLPPTINNVPLFTLYRDFLWGALFRPTFGCLPEGNRGGVVPHPDPAKPPSPLKRYPNYDPRQPKGYRSVYHTDGRILPPSQLRDSFLEETGRLSEEELKLRTSGLLGWLREILHLHPMVYIMGCVLMMAIGVLWGSFIFRYDMITGELLPPQHLRQAYYARRNIELEKALRWYRK